MKRKEITKFLAMMMCVAMVTGSGVPVTAADFSSDEAVVETVTEDEPDVETANDDDTDAGIVSADENEEYTDADETGVDAADLFTDEDDTADVGENEEQPLKLNATINGKDAEVVYTDEIDKHGKQSYKIVNISFKESDITELDNNIVIGAQKELYECTALDISTGVDDKRGELDADSVLKNLEDNTFKKTETLNKADIVDGTKRYCKASYDKDGSEYTVCYTIVYHVKSESTETKQELSLTGNLFSEDGSYQSDSRTAEITDTTKTENGMDFKVVNLTFDSKDGCEDNGLAKLKLMPAAEKSATIILGNTTSKNGIADLWDKADDGTYTWTKNTIYGNLGRGQGPAQGKTNVYCQVTHKDGTSDYYLIKAVRKGYEGIEASWGLSEDKPLNGVWNESAFDTNTGTFKSYIPLMSLTGYAMGNVKIYDQDGNKINNYSLAVNPDYKGTNFYLGTDGFVYAKGAGATSDFLILKSGDKSWPVYIRATFDAQNNKREKLLKPRITDGHGVTLNTENFANADEFAALFPEKDKETAKTFYGLVTDCQKALENSTWDSQIGSSEDGKVFWSEDCDSAKLNKVIELAPSIWENIYGLKDAEDALKAVVKEAPEEKQEELQKTADETIKQLKKDYEDEKISSVEAVSRVVDSTTKAMQEAALLEMNLTVPVTSFNKTAGDAAFALNATSSVEGAELTYTSDNEKVATVDKDGKVTPVAEGTAVITVKATAKNYKDATATVTVKVAKKAETPVPGNKDNTTVTPAPTQTPSTTTVETYKILNVAKKAVTKTEGNKAFNLGVKTKVKGSVAYKTSNKKVVTVDKKGKVTVKGPGRAVITVTGKANGLKTETAKITVTVKPSAKLSAKAAAQSGKKLKVTWKRNKKATGYQIVVATDKSFKHVVKTVNIKKNKTVKATVKGLKSGQKYYVRVRSFKKATGGNVYGNWAKTKPVKAVK